MENFTRQLHFAKIGSQKKGCSPVGHSHSWLIWIPLARHLTSFHATACYTNCLSVALMTLHCSGWSFLEKRRQSVVLEGEHSHSVPVTSGVPQGSVLGPLRFLILINDLSCYVKSRVHLFTDDTVIYLTIKTESDCWQLQDDLHSLEKWESDWRMEFNPSKCNIVMVTRRHTPFKFQYKLHGKVLETVDTTKYLGINLLHDFHWNDHVHEITTKATFYATISAFVWPNPKNKLTKPSWNRLLNTVLLSGTLT